MYPFWTSVFTKNKGVPRAGEGVIIPGFNTEDSQVSLSGLSRKIYVTDVYGMHKLNVFSKYLKK